MFLLKPLHRMCERTSSNSCGFRQLNRSKSESWTMLISSKFVYLIGNRIILPINVIIAQILYWVVTVMISLFRVYLIVQREAVSSNIYYSICDFLIRKYCKIRKRYFRKHNFWKHYLNIFFSTCFTISYLIVLSYFI